MIASFSEYVQHLDTQTVITPGVDRWEVMVMLSWQGLKSSCTVWVSAQEGTPDMGELKAAQHKAERYARRRMADTLSYTHAQLSTIARQAARNKEAS